jgi:O-antigen ligase
VQNFLVGKHDSCRNSGTMRPRHKFTAPASALATFAALLAAAQVAAAFVGRDLYIVVAIFYGVCFLVLSRNDVYGRLTIYFTIPFLLVLIALNFDRIVAGGFLELDARDQRLFLFPLLALLFLAAADAFGRYIGLGAARLTDAVAAGLALGLAYLLFRAGGDLQLGVLLTPTRSSGLLSQYNHNLADDIYIAIAILSALVTSGYLARPASPLNVVVAIAFALVFAYATAFLIQGQSRGAWLAIVVAGLAMAILRWRYGLSRRTAWPIVAIAVLVIILKADIILQRADAEGMLQGSIVGAAVAQPVAVPSTEQIDLSQPDGNSVSIRFQLWADGLRLIASHPVRGFFGWDEPAMLQYAEHPDLFEHFDHLHNLWMDMAVRFGIVFLAGNLIAFAIILWLVFGAIRRAPPGAADSTYVASAVLFYFVFLVIENVVDTNLPQREVFAIVLMFCALAGFSISACRNFEDQRRTERNG